jgi:hypothetical protein
MLNKPHIISEKPDKISCCFYDNKFGGKNIFNGQSKQLLMDYPVPESVEPLSITVIAK